MVKKSSSFAVLFLGTLLVILACFGGQAGSKVSLIMGLIFGFSLIVSSLFMFLQKKIASYVATFITLALFLTFCIRYVSTGKTLPGVLAMICCGMLIYLTAQTIRWKK